MEDKNFIEVESVDAANAIDMTVYSFVKFSDNRNCYIFKKRCRR